MASASSIWGTNMSRDVRELPPNKSWKGVMAEGRDVSGTVRVIQHAMTTYSFHRVGHALHRTLNTSSILATLVSRVTRRSVLYLKLKPVQRYSIIGAANSPPPSAGMNEGTPSVRDKSRSKQATP